KCDRVVERGGNRRPVVLQESDDIVRRGGDTQLAALRDDSLLLRRGNGPTPGALQRVGGCRLDPEADCRQPGGRNVCSSSGSSRSRRVSHSNLTLSPRDRISSQSAIHRSRFSENKGSRNTTYGRCLSEQRYSSSSTMCEAGRSRY